MTNTDCVDTDREQFSTDKNTNKKKARLMQTIQSLPLSYLYFLLKEKALKTSLFNFVS